MSGDVAAAAPTAKTGTLVFRNTLFLLVAQAITTPLSVLLNAALGRYLGPAEFGLLYVAMSFCGFGMILVEWGQSGTLPAMVARDRSSAGALLGSAIVFRLFSWVAVCAGMVGIASLFGYGRELLITLALVACLNLLQGLVAAFLDTVRGFERTDVTAYGNVSMQLATAVFVIVALVLGGRLWTALFVQIGVALVVLAGVTRVLGPVGVGKLEPSLPTVRRLAVEGFPFLFFGVSMVLQTTVDAAFMSKLAPPDVVGWYAAARRLIGVLVSPAVALVSALYPTLCRLHVEDPEGFRNTASKGVRAALLIAVPAALGCLLYPELGTSIFSRDSFGPAEANLRIFALFLLLVYVSMLFGASLIAAGRQKAWASVQLLCVMVSLVLDPLLIPYFQTRFGNGGLGVCVAAVVSELVMVTGAIWLMPRGVFGRSFVRQLVPLVVAGGSMAAAAYLLAWLTPFIAAPISVFAYVAALWLSGGLEPEYVARIREFFARKLARR